MAQLQVEQALRSLIIGLAGGAVFGGIAPETQRAPFITFQRVSGSKVRDINGPSGLAQTTFQIDAYDDDYVGNKTLADDIRKILDGFRGTVTIGPDSIDVGGVSMQGERDFVESETDPKLYRASVDYLFTYHEEP